MDASVRVTGVSDDPDETMVEEFEQVVVEAWTPTDDDGNAITTGPLGWVNHAGVAFDEEDDSVTLHVSIGDPRGAFTFTVRRIPADAENELAGRLIMHVPYPDAPMLHAPLRELHTGTYVIEHR